MTGSRRTRLLTTLVATGLALWAGAEARAADCRPAPARAVEFEVLSCRPAAVVLAEEVAGTRLWWLPPYLESVAEGNPGVVVSGTVARSRQVERSRAVGPWTTGGEQTELFFTSSDPDFCATFEGVDTAMALEEKPCCEIVPPANVACVLDLWEGRSLTPDLRRAIEEPSQGDSTDDGSV